MRLIEFLFRPFPFGNVLQNAGNAVNAPWPFNGEIRDEHLPFPNSRIGVFHFILDHLPLETLIHFSLHKSLKEVLVGKIRDKLADELFSRQASHGQVGLIGNHIPVVAVDHRNQLIQAFQGLLILSQPLLPPLMLNPRAQGVDAVGQIIGKFGEECHLLGVKSIGLRRVDHQAAQNLILNLERQGDGRDKTPPAGVLTPQSEAGIGKNVPRYHGFLHADGSARGSLPAFRVCPGDSGCLQVLSISACNGHRAHRLAFVVLGKTHPGHAVAALTHQGCTNLVQELRLILRPHQDLVAIADGAQGAV